tara:strand:+ start:302 stop:688 length:387 start_codon:yes stop_codon:yes gene_type:complete
VKTDSRALIWNATNELGDWFSRLGGGNRYFGMYESEIFLYVACRILDQHTGTTFVDEFVHPLFLEHGKKPILKSNECISKISENEQELKLLVLDYVLHIDEKLRRNSEASNRWSEFLLRVSADSDDAV